MKALCDDFLKFMVSFFTKNESSFASIKSLARELYEVRYDILNIVNMVKISPGEKHSVINKWQVVNWWLVMINFDANVG